VGEGEPPSGDTGSAGDAINLAGDEARLLRGQEHVDWRDFHRLAGTPQCGMFSKVLDLFLRLAARRLQHSPERPRRDGIDPDPFLYELLRKRPAYVRLGRQGRGPGFRWMFRVGRRHETSERIGQFGHLIRFLQGGIGPVTLLQPVRRIAG
jgi:hypothetical protein